MPTSSTRRTRAAPSTPPAATSRAAEAATRGDNGERIKRASGRLSLTVQYAESSTDLPARPLLRKWAAAAVERDARVTLRFVDAQEGNALNRAYRGVDRATNVLAFVYDDEGGVVSGDVVLCIPLLRQEAREQGKTMLAHCAHLVVHGMLHVQGYDHARVVEARAMERREAAILGHLGFPDPYA